MQSKATMESGKVVGDKKGINTNDVLIQISDSEQAFLASKSFQKNPVPQQGSSNNEVAELESLRCRVEATINTTCASPEILTSTTTANKPPKIPADQVLTRAKSLARYAFLKPKSRLVEPHNWNDAKLVEVKTQSQLQFVNSTSPFRNSLRSTSPSRVAASPSKENLKSGPITPKKPLVGSTGLEEEEDDDEEVYQTASLNGSQKKGKKIKVLVIMEWIVFVLIMGLLIASLTLNKLQNRMIWGLELWKWCVLVSVIFCGRLFTGWFIDVLVFSIERNFLLKKKVLYFVYGLKGSVRLFVWLSLVLFAWCLLFNRGVKRTIGTTKILNHITRALISFLIGAAIWLVKTFLVKLLAASFQCTRFFDRIQESIFHQYVLRTLSGPPLMEIAERVRSASTSGHLSFRNLEKQNKDKKEEVIDVEKLKKMKREKISAWTMKGLVNVISGSGLSTIAKTLEGYDDEEGEQKDKEITSEWEAKAAAYQIFGNVAKHGSKYIEEDDLLRYMKKEDVNCLLPLFEGAVETGKIKRSIFKNWVVNSYLERKSLAHSSNDTKTAIEELNKLASVVVLVVATVLWLLVMGFLTTQILVLISSQLLLVAFMFGNTAKTIFEAIIFVFVMHPFDVGDRCVIDGVQMVVEEMNILTTAFLRYDNEKIIYPNSVLATKPISNFYRSPEMSDFVDFAVDVSTSVESIGDLKFRIKMYLKSKPHHWRPDHCVLVKEIENVNKMQMALYVNHTINFQNYGDKSTRRSELILEMKKIFEDLGIKYHLLPQEVHLSYVGSTTSIVPPPVR